MSEESTPDLIPHCLGLLVAACLCFVILFYHLPTCLFLALAVEQALLWRQWLVKRRSWGTTATEVLSPIFLMSLLVYAYTLVRSLTIY